MRIHLKFTGLMIGFLLLLGTRGSVLAQSNDRIFINASGFWIEGNFYEYYRQIEQPEIILGLPLTNQFIDPLSGVSTQYFENGRLESKEEGNSEVKLAPLGKLMYEDKGTAATWLPWSSSCQKFDNSSFFLCFAFKEFYQSHDGNRYFGRPISNIELRDGHYVQYFENTRLEWQPEYRDGPRIVVSDLGRRYFDTLVGSLPDESQISPEDYSSSSIKLEIRAFVEHALMAPDNQQILFIVAVDQNQTPVEGATSGVTVHLPHKDTFYRPPATDGNGVSKLVFTIDEVPDGEIVTIDVTTSYLEHEEVTSTWFRVQQND